jgi:asparagine synthase (glutamine-hydrolysing)
MCGIAGFVDFAGHAPEEARVRVRRMADTLRHRGPDGEGVWVDGHAALGHRRLAIIDIETGQQPMAAADGRVQIVFNGEIYNYLDLRRELTGLGHVFRTQSDTEVILAGYLQWGDEVTCHLNGMFAFGIWDARAQRLLLARDRAGEKPLYWAQHGGRIAFASELRALRALEPKPDDIDVRSLDCYFTLGYVPAPRTIYRGVRKLQAAHVLAATRDDLVERRYWALPAGEPRRLSMDEALDEFEPLFDDAVRRQMISDVPLGAFLSGGLDSALVVSSMARNAGRVITNSIGSEDARFNELPQARAVADALGTEHHEYVVKPNAVETIQRIGRHLDEPLADSSAIPTWYVCEMARRNVTVALSGDGGDESFGGYTFRYVPHVAESGLRARLPTAVRVPVFGALGAVWPASARLPQPLRLRTIFGNLARSDSAAYYEDLVWLKSDSRERLYAPRFAQELAGFSPMELVKPCYEQGGGTDPLSRSQRADLQVYMADDVLAKVDRMSMAHSLETRAPLLDYRILEFAARLPAELKLNRGVGKVLLRRLAQRRLPAKVATERKRGFSVPLADWLRGELAEFAYERIFAHNRVVAEHLNVPFARLFWTEHYSGARDHSVVLWGLMMLGLWDETRR